MFVAGYGMGGVAENTGMGFVKLKDYAERTKPGQDAASVAARMRQTLRRHSRRSVHRRHSSGHHLPRHDQRIHHGTAGSRRRGP